MHYRSGPGTATVRANRLERRAWSLEKENLAEEKMGIFVGRQLTLHIWGSRQSWCGSHLLPL